MKKVLSLVVLFAFLMMPPVSLAKSTAISDSDLEGIVAQSGSITITFDNITVKSTDLKTTSTDFADFWGPHHADYFGPAHPDYEVQNSGAYFGYANVYLTGGEVERSGSITLEIVPTPDSNISTWGDRLNVDINSLTIRSSIGVEASIKLGTTPDLSGNQYLGYTYTSGVSATTDGKLYVYAHK